MLAAAVIFSAFPVSAFAYENGIITLKEHEADEEVLTPRVTYHFLGRGYDTDQYGISTSEYYEYINDAQDLVSKQILQDGEKLVEPPAPAPVSDDDDQVTVRSRFYGWYVVRPVSVEDDSVTYEWPAEDSRFDFRKPVSVSEDGEVYLAALYQNSRFLVFHEDTLDGTNREGIVSRKIAALTARKKDSNAVVDISGIKAPLQNARNEYFYGWSYYDENGSIQTIPFYDESGAERQEVLTNVTGRLFGKRTVSFGGKNYAVNDDDTLDLYPVYVNAHWLNFDTAKTGGGAKYVSSKFVTQQTVITHLDVSEMKGYVFEGWYADDDTKVADSSGALVRNVSFQGGSVRNGQLSLTQDVTLKAKWQADSTSSYKVIYWFENAGDSGYTYAYHVVRTGRQAEVMTNETAPSVPDVTPPDGANKEGFHLYGSDPLTYPAETDPRYLPERQQRLIANDDSTVVNIYYNRNIVTLTFQENNRTVHTITGKYGLKIKSEFENAPLGTTYKDRKWTDTAGVIYNAQYPFKTLEELPYKSVTLSSTKSDLKGSIYYYTELLPGQTSDITFGGRYFALHKKIEHNFNFLTYNEDFHPIEGFYADRSHASPAFGSNDRATANSPYNYYLYYYRESYQIRFMFYDGYTDDLVLDNICFEDDISTHTASSSQLAKYVPDRYEEDINNVRMVFKGWYDNPALEGEPVDLTAGKMPSHDVTLHAKWEKKYYIVKIDTAGGVLSQGDSTWFYREHGSSFDRYTVTRDYIVAEEGYTGTKYYRVDEVYDPAYDYYSDGYAGGSSTYRRRSAYITEEQFPEYEDQFIDKTTVYKYERNAFSLMGWYAEDENGNIHTDRPYNFSDPVTDNITIKALWRRSGLYYLYYDAVNTAQDENGELHTITGFLDDEQTITALFDPDEEGKLIGKGYNDKAKITLNAAPEGFEDTDGREWVFEGWQAYSDGEPITVLLSPGEEQVIYSEWSSQNVITFKAVYAVKSRSVHIPKTVDLILDGNDGGEVHSSEVNADNEYIGVYHASDRPASWGSWKDQLNEGVWFDKQYNNGAYRLSDYADRNADSGKPVFSHKDGYLLLGWDQTKDPLQLPNGAYVPTYAPDGLIAVHREQTDKSTTPDILYAVWEPMVYLTFVNETGKDLTFSLNGLSDDALSVINLVQGRYDRQPFAFGENRTVTLPKDETLMLSMPKGDGAHFSILGQAGQIDQGKNLVIRTFDVSSHLESEETYSFNTNFSTESTLKTGKNSTKIVFSTEEQWALTLDLNYAGAPDATKLYLPFYDSSVSLPLPARYGYFFAGWAETPDGKKKYGAENVSAESLFPDPSQKQKTLYALWKSQYVDVPVRYLLRENNGTLREVTGNTSVIGSSAKTSISNVSAASKSVAYELRYSAYYSVQYYLTDSWISSYRRNYTEVAYAFGDASANKSGTTAGDFGLQKIVNNNDTDGAPNIRNTADGLQWNDSSNFWSGCGEDTAVYVIFSRATMVQVNIRCELKGDFASDDEEVTYTAVFGGKGTLASGRQTETFTLKNGESYPITLSKSTGNNYQTVTVTQTRYPQYATTVTSDTASAAITESQLKAVVSAQNMTAPVNVTYQNVRANVPVTGTENNAPPFAVMLMVGITLIAGFVVLGSVKNAKRKTDVQDDIL